MRDRPVVLITGAAVRLGRQMALEMAAHGWDVAVHCHRSVEAAHAVAQELQGLGAQAAVVVADLSDGAACRAIVGNAVDQLGRLDAVVNNASAFVYDDAASFAPSVFESLWRANTAAPVLLAQALHAHAMHTKRQGCVVNLLDQKLWNPNPDYFSYTLTKAALQSATVMLAQALAPVLRVCAVAPGVTLPSGPMTDAQFAAAHAMTPLRRSSTPDDIARAVRFLIESPAITGTTLLVDGGQHLSAQPRDVLYLAPQP
jgi:hypothetical protein